MTIPRRVVPGTTYLITRRCLDRRSYLRPGQQLNRIYQYALARAALKHGVQVHLYCCMSNHSHELVTDVHGVLPDFLRDFHREVALAAKELYGISENFWSAAKPSAVEVHGPLAQSREALYVLLNPSRAGLVARAKLWPGAISLPGTRAVVAVRPNLWFSKLAENALELELTPPPAYTGTDDEWHAWLASELRRCEDEIITQRRAAHRPFLGAHRVLEQDPFDRPRSADETKPSRHPVVAAGGDRSLMQRVLKALVAWRRAYYEARDAWRLDKSSVFPMGTWWLVQRANASFA